MIVKIEMHTVDEGAPVTITRLVDKREKLVTRLAATRPLLARMRGKLLAYFQADVSTHEVEIGDEVPAAAWC